MSTRITVVDIIKAFRRFWFITLVIGQIIFFTCFFYFFAGDGQLGNPTNLNTYPEPSSSQRDISKFEYLRPTWKTVYDFLCYCEDFDSSAQEFTDSILGPLVSLFNDRKFDISEATDALNEYEALKSKSQRRLPVEPSTCIPWVDLDQPARPPRIAMMTIAIFPKTQTESEKDGEGKQEEGVIGDGKKEEDEGEGREEKAEVEEARILLEEGVAVSLADKQEYCHRHGYDFYAISETPRGRPAPWMKIPAALSLLSQQYDWVILVDIDAVIIDHSVKLEEFTDPRYDTIIGVDRHGVNTGVLFLRNTVWSRLFLAEAWTLTDEPLSAIWWEQASIVWLIKAEGVRNHVKLCPQTHFNSYIRGRSLKDSFIIHFAGSSKKEKWLNVLKYYGLRKKLLAQDGMT